MLGATAGGLQGEGQLGDVHRGLIRTENEMSLPCSNNTLANTQTTCPQELRLYLYWVELCFSQKNMFKSYHHPPPRDLRGPRGAHRV